MKAKIAVAAMLVTGSAHATEPTIIDACVRAAEIYFQTDSVKPTSVQAFPELNPPRVRALMSGDGIPAPMADQLASLLGGLSSSSKSTETVCEFSSASAPFELQKFDCGVCLMTSKRLDELQTLLEREGL